MPPKNKNPLSLRIAALLALAFHHTPAAALGLGPAVGNPILGRPLRIEVEIIGGERDSVAAHCFKLTRPQAPVDDTYALKGAQLAVERSDGRAYVVVSHPSAQHPIIEFSLQVACGAANLARDYILLASPEPAPKPGLAPPTATSAGVTLPAAATPPRPTPAADAPTPPRASVIAAATLEKLARQNYPNQPKAREKYKRMMRAANAALFPAGVDSDHYPLPDGTALKLPPGLPERRLGPYQPSPRESKPSPPARVPAAPVEESKSATTAAKPAATLGGDRLKIGAASTPLSVEAAEAELVRIENIHTELNQTQQQIASKLDSAEAAFGELKNHLLRMENRVRELEAEREQEAQRRKVAEAIQLIIAVLLGGMTGAALLRFLPPYLERRMRPTADEALATRATRSPTPAPTQIVSVFSGMQANAPAPDAAPPVLAVPATPTPETPPGQPPTVEPAPNSAPPAYDFDFVSWLPEQDAAHAAPASDQPLPPNPK